MALGAKDSEKYFGNLEAVKKDSDLILYDTNAVMPEIIYIMDAGRLSKLNCDKLEEIAKDADIALQFLHRGVHTIPEVVDELQRGYELLRVSHRWLFRGRSRDIKISNLLRRIRQTYLTIVNTASSTVEYEPEACTLFKEIFMRLEDTYKLKELKNHHNSESYGEHLRTDEKLLGVAFGRALEGKKVALISNDSDLSNMMMTYSYFLLCKGFGNRSVMEAIARSGVSLYSIINDRFICGVRLSSFVRENHDAPREEKPLESKEKDLMTYIAEAMNRLINCMPDKDREHDLLPGRTTR